MRADSAKQVMCTGSRNGQCLAKANKRRHEAKEASSMGGAGGWSEVFTVTALRLSVSPRASSSGPGSGWG